MAYSVHTDRDTLVNEVNSSKKFRGRIDWISLHVVLNNLFNENTTIEGWRGRYGRALRFGMARDSYDKISFYQNSLENSIYNDPLKSQAKAQVLTEQVLEALLKQSPKVSFKAKHFNHKTQDNYVFVTSDFHYDGDHEMFQSLNNAYESIINKQKIHNFKKITLLELGDVVEGSHLRPSQLLFIKSLLIPQIVEVAKYYADFINQLSKTMYIDFYCVTSSNHTQTRAFGSKRNELVEDDAMVIFAEMLKALLSNNKNFNITFGKDFIVQITESHKMFVAHGHLLNGFRSGYVQELAMARGIEFDYSLFGHFHHYREITLYARPTYNMKVFYAPSMNTKHSSYEADRNLNSKAGILFMVFNKERGHKYSEELFV
jgi:hypothetical protein